MITVGELFAGIGGIGLGLEMTGGFEVKWQVEKDEYATKVLEKNWPDVRRHDDVCTFPTEDEDGDWQVDMITAGFPCQDLSFAGKGAGLKGERSGLFYEVVRIAERLRPRYLLLENVSALLVRGMGEVLRALAEIGYDAQWHCIPAVSVGALHRRDRVFIIANPKYDGFDGSGEDEHKCKCKEVGRCEQLGRDGCNGAVADTNSKRLQGQWKLGEAGEVFAQKAIGVFSGRVGTNQWGIEPKLGRVANGVPHRVDRLRGLGNAVVPQVVQFIGEQILKHERQDVTQ